jgi:hypothetical protein
VVNHWLLRFEPLLILCNDKLAELVRELEYIIAYEKAQPGCKRDHHDVC